MSARISIELPVAHDQPRHSIGLHALRASPASGFLTALVPMLFVCAAFGYLAYVCLLG